MQLKTVEEVNETFWDNVLFVSPSSIKSDEIGVVTDQNITNLLTQDRADIHAVLKAALDELDAPMSNDPYCDSYSGYGRAISDAISVIDTLLPGDVSN